jgi:predicted  nucleic acid-binding Zn-ribbon protein
MSTTKQEIALMKKDIETLSEEVKEINNKIDNLTLKLLDPDDGVVSRVNKNTRFRKSHDKEMPGYNTIIDEFRELQRWKSVVTKALWGLYTAVLAWIVKILFW